jgi:hypothetical protein
MRQLIDAGTLSNLPGGLKSRGLRIKGDDTPIAPGEFRDVDVGSGNIRDNILPLPYKEPSQTLYTLLNNIVEEGRRFAATADMKISDMGANAPVGSTLALLERQLKVMTAVQARVHFALKQELQLLSAIIRDYTDDEYSYEPDGAIGARAKKSDYRHVDILPVSDPNAATLSQRVVQYQAVIQLAQSAPDIYDLPKLHRGMLEVLGIKHADKLVPLEEDQKPTDPVSENMNALKGKPIKAFQYQDHEAHIKVHMSAMQDPKIMQLLQGNPMAQALQQAMMAHINEHLGFQYRVEIEKQLGMTLPPTQDESGEDINMDPAVEAKLAPMLAQAAQQLLQMNKSQAAQQQAQQQAQDPLLQLQQKEVSIKEADQARKAAKDMADAELNKQRLVLEEQKIQIDKGKALAAIQSGAEKQRYDALKSAATMKNDKEKMMMQAAAEALKEHYKPQQRADKPKKGE